MTSSDLEIIERRPGRRLPPRKADRQYSPLAPRRETWLERSTRRCGEVCQVAWARRRLSLERAKPWLLITAALVCVALTWSFKVMTGRDSRPVTPPEVEPQSELPVAVAPVQPGATEKPAAAPHPDQKQPLHIVGLDEIATLKARTEASQRPQESQKPNSPAEKDPSQDLLLDRRPADPQTYSVDPETGAWVTPNNVWQVRTSYHLPIAGREVTMARQCLAQIGVETPIELEWWLPRAVEVPQKHWKGKLAKLQFLAVLPLARVHRAEEYIRVVQVRGDTADGRVLVEAVALFFSPEWKPVTSAVKEEADWFAGEAKNVKKGVAGRLPISGADIAPVRKALAAREGQGRIREAEWWAPRFYRTIGHRLSKLRYEATHNGTTQLQEIVFDHDLNRSTRAELPPALFPEDEGRILRLDSPR